MKITGIRTKTAAVRGGHEVESHDVIVCGGGTAGMIAALASARTGARTLLVEHKGYLGGTATDGIPFLGFFSGEGKQVVGGMPQELVNRMVAAGGCMGHMRGGQWRQELRGGKNHEFSLTPFDPECLKHVAQSMLLEAGVKLILHASLSGVERSGDRIASIQVLTVEGGRSLEARSYVDCTGDALMTWFAGFPSVTQGRGRMQNVTSVMRVGNVDAERILRALEAGQGISGRDDWHTRIVKGRLIGGQEGLVHLAGRAELWKNRPAATFTAVWWRVEEMSLNITRTINIDPTSAADVTLAEISERENIHQVMSALRSAIPGFERAYLIGGSFRVGIREGRRIRGRYVLNEEEVLGGRDFADGIARGAYPIDIHDPKGGSTRFQFIEGGGSFAVPYRCLIPESAANLTVAGRCVSATSGALGSVRLMPCCMAMGQAAGTAAALAVGQGTELADLDPAALRVKLLEHGAILT